MAIDLVPKNCDFRIEGWHYLTDEENENIVITEVGRDGEPIVYKRSELHLPPNVLTLTEKQWKPFWMWVAQRNSTPGSIFSKQELRDGSCSAGLYVSQHQCDALALDLDAALQAGSSIPAHPTVTVDFIYHDDEKLPVVGWVGEFPIVERQGQQVAVVEFDSPEMKEKSPTRIYTEETAPQRVTTHEDGTQTVGDTDDGRDWEYWTLPRYIAIALLEFIRKSNGFTIL